MAKLPNTQIRFCFVSCRMEGKEYNNLKGSVPMLKGLEQTLNMLYAIDAKLNLICVTQAQILSHLENKPEEEAWEDLMKRSKKIFEQMEKDQAEWIAKNMK